MRKKTGKIIICIIITIALIVAGSYLTRISNELNDKIARLKKGTPVEVTLTEHPKGNYSSDTQKYLWKYSFVNAEGKTITSSTADRYSKEELQKTDYKMTVYIVGDESMEAPYLFGDNEAGYGGAIAFFVLSVFPLLGVAWIIIERRLFYEVLRKGETYYAEFLGAFREGSYYKVKFGFEVNGEKIIKTSQAAYSLGTVEVFKTNGAIEIKYYKNRAAISQKLLGAKLQ